MNPSLRFPTTSRHRRTTTSSSKRIALITGASSGIGLELAKLFAADGYDLVLVARRESELAQLARELEATLGTRCTVIAEDLADPDAAPRIKRRLDDDRVEVDVLVNNAGFGALGRVADLGVGRQAGMVDVNVRTLTAMTALFLPDLVRRGHGGILNVGSTAAFQPGPNMAAYYATKAFVQSFTEALAEEMRGSGVRISCLAPGPTQTGFGKRAGSAGSRLFKRGVMSADRVARDGYRGFRHGRVTIVPGVTNRALALFARHSPRWMTRRIVKLLNS